MFAANLVSVTDLTTLVDLRGLFDENVSVCIGQDGNAKGNELFVSEGVSITDLGAKLGAVSSAAVHESISYVDEFPMVTDGFEFSELAFANGNKYKDLSNNLINGIVTRVIYS